MGNEEKIFPGVFPTYALAVSSYEVMRARFDAANALLQNLLTVIVSINLGIGALPKLTKIELEVFPFATAFFVGAVATIICIVARLWGTLTIVDTRVLWNEFLEFNEWEFKYEFIHHSRKSLKKNLNVIGTKHRWSCVASSLLATEVGIVIWVIATT